MLEPISSYDLPRRAHLSALWRVAAFTLAFLVSGCGWVFKPIVTTDMFEDGNFQDSQVAIINGCRAGLHWLTVDGRALKPPADTTRSPGMPSLYREKGSFCVVRVLPGKHDLAYRVGWLGRVPDVARGGEIDVKAGHTYNIKVDSCSKWMSFRWRQIAWVEDEAGNVVHGDPSPLAWSC